VNNVHLNAIRVPVAALRLVKESRHFNSVLGIGGIVVRGGVLGAMKGADASHHVESRRRVATEDEISVQIKGADACQ